MGVAVAAIRALNTWHTHRSHRRRRRRVQLSLQLILSNILWEQEKAQDTMQLTRLPRDLVTIQTENICWTLDMLKLGRRIQMAIECNCCSFTCIGYGLGYGLGFGFGFGFGFGSVLGFGFHWPQYKLHDKIHFNTQFMHFVWLILKCQPAIKYVMCIRMALLQCCTAVSCGHRLHSIACRIKINCVENGFSCALIIN